ncbi:dTDP-4-dehydrorhamnose 3,5-epimerase [Aerococcaceae bacterium zg-ZUI334]|uniref:dTDP-4-dehydrorhamnose 3,5-epimerase n=1 Tax=Aerococcaceae bacterium zg-252 TaxID=2796928 RepID=UPI001B9707C0|nr:dTDP-4-dehydrorhamnose 3,5-epimerase [Aerococcaceae bacterium zg-ZUI334]
MRIRDTKLQDVKIIETNVFGDHRGFFTESYSERNFKELGITMNFVQDNHSFSAESGVLRGLHFQRGRAAQTKLVRVTSGVVWDVVVDLRKGSPTYGQWEGFILSEHNQRQLLVPKGFAHGFVTLTPNVNFMYKCDAYYDTQADSGIAFDDETIGIEWPIDVSKAILSEKDKKHASFLEFELNNEFVYGEI